MRVTSLMKSALLTATLLAATALTARAEEPEMFEPFFGMTEPSTPSPAMKSITSEPPVKSISNGPAPSAERPDAAANGSALLQKMVERLRNGG